MRNKHPYSVVLTLVLVLAMTGCGNRQETAKNADSLEGIPITAVKAKKTDIYDKLHVIGTVFPFEQNNVYAKASGRLTKYLVDEGAMVKKDDVVAYIDRDEPGYDFSASPVKSPAKGMILKRYIDAGATVSPAAGSVSMATPLFSVGDISKVKIFVNVVEADIGRVKIGQDAEVCLEAFCAKTFIGKITNISPTADSMSHSSRVEILLDNKDNLLKPGLSADVNLLVAKAENAVVIPRTALIRKSGEIFVYVIKGDSASKTLVEPGYDDGKELQIIKGLSAGETVANSDFNVLQEGLKVKAEIK